MAIGKIYHCEDQRLRGAFTTALHHIEFGLSPVAEEDRRSDKAPTHTIQYRGPHGKWAEIGVAWKQKITRGEHDGADMFSLQITDPDFSDLRLAAFPNGKAGEWEIQRERPRAGLPNAQDVAKNQATMDAANGRQRATQDPAGLDDEIPF